MFQTHLNHIFLNQYAISTLIMNLSVLCYTVFHFYILIESDNKNTFIRNKIFHTNEQQFKFLIKSKLKHIFYEQVFFRVYVFELMNYSMKYIVEEEVIHIVWSVIFASYYFHTYRPDYKIRIGKMIEMFLISFYVFYSVPVLASLIIHMYTELFSIIFSNFLYNNFDINIKPKSISNNEEFATKDEVETMLSNKKFD